MKSALLGLALILTASSAFAARPNVLLECNLSFGPNQAVRVLETENGLVLEELTNKGSIQRRALTAEEYKSNQLQLRIESPFEKGTLTLEQNGNWFYDLGGAKGYANCR